MHLPYSKQGLRVSISFGSAERILKNWLWNSEFPKTSLQAWGTFFVLCLCVCMCVCVCLCVCVPRVKRLEIRCKNQMEAWSWNLESLDGPIRSPWKAELIKSPHIQEAATLGWQRKSSPVLLRSNVMPINILLLLLSRFSRVRLCAIPYMAAHQAPPSLGFSRQEHWNGLPFPSPMHESEK